MPITPTQFVLWFLRAGIILVVLVTAFQLWLDPFWAWRRTPPWLGWHGGHNWNLDIRMRSAKALQLLTRDTETILIGSSRTYHGFDVSRMPRTYNLGISGLRIREMEAYVRYAIMHTEVKHLVIGLDYFMFDKRHPTVAGFNPSLTHPRHLFDAVPAAIYSADALGGARYAIKGNKAREGVWDYYGHKALFPIGPEKIPEILEAERENLTWVEPDKEGLHALSRLLRDARSHRVRVSLYLSPVHPLQRGILREADGHGEKRFARWVRDMHRIARMHALPLHDLTQLRLEDGARLGKEGTTPYWQDVTHFTPKTGAIILRIIDAHR